MSEGNAYRLIVTLPKGDGIHANDLDVVEEAQAAVRAGLCDRMVEFDGVKVEEVPPPPKRRADIPVGTRVLVTTFASDDREPMPFAARVHGYDMHHTKYRLNREFYDGQYASGGHTWAFVNQVELHPDETPAGPQTGAEPAPGGNESEGMTTGEFVNMVVNGPNWNKAEEDDDE